MSFRVASMFAGIGGIDLGFSQSGCQVVWANEIDSAACKTYQHNFPDISLVEQDIHKINVESIPDFDILTEGKDMTDAVEMARDAIELKCVSMEDDGMEIPLPSELTSLDTSYGTFAEEGTTIVSLVDIDSGEYRKKIDTKAVRKNVTLPSWLNYEAEHAGINVSKVLQEALMKALHVQQRF